MFSSKNFIKTLLIVCTLHTSAQATMMPAISALVGATCGIFLYNSPRWRKTFQQKFPTGHRVAMALHALGGAVTGACLGIFSEQPPHVKFFVRRVFQRLQEEAQLTEVFLDELYQHQGLSYYRNTSSMPAPRRTNNDAEHRAQQRARRIFFTRLREEKARVEELLDHRRTYGDWQAQQHHHTDTYFIGIRISALRNQQRETRVHNEALRRWHAGERTQPEDWFEQMQRDQERFERAQRETEESAKWQQRRHRGKQEGGARREEPTDSYYAILGIAQNATQADIQTAYRKQAKKLHPDKNPNDPTATAKFQRLQQAYQTLYDENSRRKYDAELNA